MSPPSCRIPIFFNPSNFPATFRSLLSPFLDFFETEFFTHFSCILWRKVSRFQVIIGSLHWLHYCNPESFYQVLIFGWSVSVLMTPSYFSSFTQTIFLLCYFPLSVAIAQIWLAEVDLSGPLNKDTYFRNNRTSQAGGTLGVQLPFEARQPSKWHYRVKSGLYPAGLFLLLVFFTVGIPLD